MDSTTYIRVIPGDPVVLCLSGSVSRRDHLVDVDRSCLPTDAEIVIPITADRFSAVSG